MPNLLVKMWSSNLILFIASVSIVFLFSVDKPNFADAFSYDCPPSIGSYTFDGEPDSYEDKFSCAFYRSEERRVGKECRL